MPHDSRIWASITYQNYVSVAAFGDQGDADAGAGALTGPHPTTHGRLWLCKGPRV